MEVEYGIGVANRYAFLYDKDDTDEDLSPKKLASAKKTAAKDSPTSGGKSKVAPIPKKDKSGDKVAADRKPKAKVTSTIPAKETKANVANRGRNEETSKENSLRAGAGSKRDERFPKAPSRVMNDGHQQMRTRDGGMPRRYRDGGRSYNERAGEKQAPRELNGHVQESGVGKSEEKNERIDSGTGTDEKVGEKGVEAQKNDGAAETQTQEVLNGTGGAGDSNNPVVEEEEEKEEITITLAEWKALQPPREKPKFNIRKPGEGEGRLGKLVPKKKEDEFSEEENVYEVEEVYYPQRAGKQKLVSDVGFRYKVPRRTRIYGHEDYIRFERNGQRGTGGKGGATKDVDGKDGATKDVDGKDGATKDVDGKDGATKDVDGKDGATEELDGKGDSTKDINGEGGASKDINGKGGVSKNLDGQGSASSEQPEKQKEKPKPELPKEQKDKPKPGPSKEQKDKPKPRPSKEQKENPKSEQPKQQKENLKPWETKQEKVTMTEEEKESKKILDYLRIKQQSLRPRRRNPRYVNIEDGYAFPTLG